MAARPLSLKARALQWLAQREHSRVELRRKLLRLAERRSAELAGDTHDAASLADLAAGVDELLDWLVAHRYLSDARFVESRVNARALRYGNVRVRLELAQHGATLDDDTAQRLTDSEWERARAVWARKFGGARAATAAERARQMRFLAGRGFSPDVIRRIVQQAAAAADDEA